MKKIIALLLAALMMVCCLSACSEDKKTDTADAKTAEKTAEKTTEEVSDLEYIKSKGKLVVGITDFEPMDYQKAGSDEWVGFDADLAKLFADSLGVECEFSVINWDFKTTEIDKKTIDCVWNGMTLTDEVTTAMSCSTPYCNNQQILIVNKEDAEKYASADDCKHLNIAVESGSAGEKVANQYGFTITPVLDQATALMEVKAGTCDAAIIDSLMAAAMVGEGTSYEELTYTVGLSDEEYGVGFRKGSDLTEKFNSFLKEKIADGTVEAIAKEYGIQAALIK